MCPETSGACPRVGGDNPMFRQGVRPGRGALNDRPHLPDALESGWRQPGKSSRTGCRGHHGHRRPPTGHPGVRRHPVPSHTSAQLRAETKGRGCSCCRPPNVSRELIHKAPVGQPAVTGSSGSWLRVREWRRWLGAVAPLVSSYRLRPRKPASERPNRLGADVSPWPAPPVVRSAVEPDERMSWEPLVTSASTPIMVCRPSMSRKSTHNLKTRLFPSGR